MAHHDRISYGGWPMDTHDPLGMMNPNAKTDRLETSVGTAIIFR